MRHTVTPMGEGGLRANNPSLVPETV